MQLHEPGLGEVEAVEEAGAAAWVRSVTGSDITWLRRLAAVLIWVAWMSLAGWAITR